MLDVVQQNISSSCPASFSASDAVFLPTADAYSILRLPHICVVLKQSRESRSGISIASRFIVVLPPHHASCFRGAFLNPAQWDMLSPVVRDVLSKKTAWNQPTSYVRLSHSSICKLQTPNYPYCELSCRNCWRLGVACTMFWWCLRTREVLWRRKIRL